MSFSRLISAALLTAAMAAPAAAQTFAVTGATVVLGDGSEPIENGTVVVRDGKIAAVGKDLMVTMDMPTINGAGKWVTPGLFLPLTDLGLYDIEAVGESDDREAGDSIFSAALDVAPAVNPSSEHIAVTRAGGATRATVIGFPDNSIFAGQGAMIDLGDDYDAVMQPRVFQLVFLGEYGARLSGGSRVAAHVEFRNALAEASELAKAGERADDRLLNRPDAAALIPVVTGEQQLVVVVDRAADILAVLGLLKDYPKLDLVLGGVTEGWLVAEQIAAAGVPVVTTGLVDLPGRFEQLGATQSNVGRMVKAGVKVALGGFTGTNTFPRYAPHYAGNLVALNKLPGADGLSWGQAFATISSVPAEISGMGGKAGVLAEGALGDVVVWDGDPLEVSSAPVHVFIDGIEQPLVSHQTRLRDRFGTPAPGDLPKAYDW